MIREKEKKKQIIMISVFITSIFVILLSVTYAFINVRLLGTKKQVLTAGELSLELLEDENNLTIENALPMYDEVGMIQDAFTFRLVNKGVTSVNYILKLVDITTGEKLDTSIVKYGLTKDGASNIQYLSNLINGQIDKGKISGSQTIEYSLRLWIDSSVEDEILIKNRSLSYKIEVEANQEIKVGSKGMIRSAGIDVDLDDENLDYDALMSSLPKDTYWQYREQITSVVFEDKIDIPNTISEENQWDVSVLSDNSVMAYVEEAGGTVTVNQEEVSAYKLHIQGNEKIIANVDSGFMFYYFSNMQTIENLKFLDTSNVTDMGAMFSDCNNLTSLDVSNFDTTNVTDMSWMFGYCTNLTSLDVSNFDTTNVTDMSWMFGYCTNLTSLDVSSFDTSNITDMKYIFYYCQNLTSLDVSNFDTTNVTDMSSMFFFCRNLTSLDVSNFDTTNVTNMRWMFEECSSLTSLDVSHFNTSNVTNMSSMFNGCESLTSLDLSRFNTANVTDMSSMFSYCTNLTSLDLSNFDTSNVTDMSAMFRCCTNLTSLDVSHFNTSNVTNMSDMFSGCESLTSLDVNHFNTSKVTNMSSMFGYCHCLISLDLSHFNTSNVTNMSYMFHHISANSKIIVQDEAMRNWVLGEDSDLTNVVVKSS